MFQSKSASERIGHLLDVGGCPSDWYGRGELVGRVTTLNLAIPGEFTPPPDSPVIESIEGDARKLRMSDGEYEVVYSNSVIEHVGTFEDQMAFAEEVRRVGGKLWIPLRWRWPFIRWGTFIGLSGAAGEYGLRCIMQTTRLLTYREFSTLFPDCEIWVERMLWVIPKSYVAIRR